jgi:RimJ/RimL family protein N-acetyltransferase
MTLHEPWTPGAPVAIETRRTLVRTLHHEDVTPTVERWLEDPAIASNVWHPRAKGGDYFRGLIAACDQKTRFGFLIVHRASQRAIGFVKLHVDPARRVQVPTSALGERAYWNYELGTEAVRGVQRFAFEHLPVDHIESRVYEENAAVRSRLERFGYREVEPYFEVLPGGPRRRVHVFRISREEWLARSPEIEARLGRLPDAPVGR